MSSKKKKGIAIALAVVLCIGACWLFTFIIILGIHIFGNQGDKNYRIVEVESYDGYVELTRDNELQDIFEGMHLISNDLVSTGSESMIELLVDTDKHIVADENTLFSLVAEGDESAGKVSIVLMEGSSLYTIDNALNEDSTFEVNTPNATLSVRGTIFRVTYDILTATTTVEVYEGVVEATTNTNSTLINAGNSAVITNDTITLGVLTEDEADGTEADGDEVAIADEEWTELLNGGCNFRQLNSALSVIQDGIVYNETDYVSIALNRMWYGTLYGFTPIREETEEHWGLQYPKYTYDVNDLNDFFSLFTTETVNENNIPMNSTLNGNELSYEVCDVTAGGYTGVTITDYYYEGEEIVIEYSFDCSYGSDGSSGMKGNSVARLTKNAEGKYTITAIDVIESEEYSY